MTCSEVTSSQQSQDAEGAEMVQSAEGVFESLLSLFPCMINRDVCGRSSTASSRRNQGLASDLSQSPAGELRNPRPDPTCPGWWWMVPCGRKRVYFT